MNAGTSFVLSEEYRDIDPHLWVVISDTRTFPDQVVIVNLTTWRDDKDQTCLVERNEHPCLTHRSCVMYEEARVTTVTFLRELRNAGKILIRDDAPPELVPESRNAQVTPPT